MKKYTFTVAALAAVMTLSLMPSCKKDDDKNSRSDMMVGTWKPTEEGDDTNKNGVWDTNEHGPIDSSNQLGSSVTFNSGGNGTVNVAGSTAGLPFSWTLLNNDNDLRIITDFGPVFGKDTAVTNIVSLTGSELITKDTAGGTASFTLAKKQ
jgi:hypothetical protein